MENVEYSAEYHRPEERWIYSPQTHVKYIAAYKSLTWAHKRLTMPEVADFDKIAI